VSEYLRANVTERYGDWNFPGLSVCAKTGTGQIGEGIKPNAMLAGFVQDENYPLAFIVFVENAGYGANVCIPIAAKVLEICKEVI
jgi:peptidoglycan glycosyltransferase